MPHIGLLILLALLSAGTPASANMASDARLEAQREVFRAVLPLAEAGQWAGVDARLAELDGYPLLPDLRAAWLRSRLGQVPDAEVAQFLAAHAELGFAPALRRQWAASLARRKAWRDYLALYEAHYAGTRDTVLECHAFTARIALGRSEGLEDAVRARWTAPTSQPDACDPAFAWFAARDGIDDATRRARMELALEAGEFRLARWLARPLGDAALAEVTRWQAVHDDPVGRLRTPSGRRDDPRQRALVLYGFRRMASTHPDIAAEHWPAFREHFAFTPGEQAAIDRRIALVHAWRHLPEAARLLEALPEASRDADTRAWAVRVALRQQHWAAVEHALAALSADAAGEPVWRYWLARMLEATGRSDQARMVYASLAGERGYYSFMAADRLGADYRWSADPVPARDEVIATLEQRPDIIRSRELFHVGLESYGRLEWQQALARMSPDERTQAAIIAQRWGWYSRAITAASSAAAHDALELRFPLAWRPLFEERSQRAGIHSAWVYGVARSESLFVPDARSSAGALGLMQLMPATGRQLARRAGLPWNGSPTLIDPDTNITLGTTYLADMLARYDGHRVLATAAYNAGPSRVDRWLPENAALPADAWVDSVPYSETRAYVQRVLAAEAVFHWRMTGQTARLADVMQPVPPRPHRDPSP
ncbi:transglycosylase SLT domain-containing protein [Thioalkalivibrio sp. XN279]|uniref:transglycosylase SLT domain-containing protein n=1 Tax=Thioalkalivibrio sp. XN279 TaxID=2714953 RepID=UPI00140AE060|nr:transglycosylase SLT domain-containing protein [Thioalkalivibrio sp. XN279]NHA14056.1 transglycosylase SLT domain-containing protein [Thioalkalivibrio sp. XN279]